MEKIGEDQSKRDMERKRGGKILKGVYTVYNQNIIGIYTGILYIRI